MEPFNNDAKEEEDYSQNPEERKVIRFLLFFKFE